MRNIGLTVVLVFIFFYFVRFVEDTQPPYFNEIDAITLERLNPGETLTFSYKTLITGLKDNSEEYVSTKVLYDGVNYREVGEYVVTLRATDIYGNVFDRNVSVEIVDTRPPYFSVPDIELRINEFEDVDWAFFLYSVFDITYDTIPVLEFEDQIDYTTEGIYTVYITAEDDQGNIGVSTFRVIIFDDTFERYERRLFKANTVINAALRELKELEETMVCDDEFKGVADIYLTAILNGISIIRTTPDELKNSDVYPVHFQVMDLMDDLEAGVMLYSTASDTCDQVGMADAHTTWAFTVFDLNLIREISFTWAKDYR